MKTSRQRNQKASGVRTLFYDVLEGDLSTEHRESSLPRLVAIIPPSSFLVLTDTHFLESFRMNDGKSQQTDRVILRRIPFSVTVGLDAWGRHKPQPVLLSLEIPYDFQKAAVTDDVSQTLDYGKLYKSLTNKLVDPSESAAELALRIRDVVQPVEFFQANVVLPKGNLRADGGLQFAFEFRAGESPGETVVMQTLSIKGIRCPCIVGVNPHEREEKQIVVVNIDYRKGVIIDGDPETLRYLLYSGTEESLLCTNMIREVVKVSLFCTSCVITIADH